MNAFYFQKRTELNTIRLQCINFIELFMILMRFLNLLWKCLFYGIPDLITPFFIDSRFCLTWKNVTTHSTHSFFGSLCASYKDIQVFSGCIWIILYRLSFIFVFCVGFIFRRYLIIVSKSSQKMNENFTCWIA